MIKRAVIFSIGFILFITLIVFYLFNYIAIKDITKRFIISQAYYNWGLKVEIEDVSISYFKAAIILEGVELRREDENLKIHLSSPRSIISFQPIQLISGNINISDLTLVSPKADIEISSLFKFKVDETTDFSVKSLLYSLFKIRIKRLNIIDSQFKIKIGDMDEISTPRGNITITKGRFVSYFVDLDIDDISHPFDYISNLELHANVKSDSVKVSKLKLDIEGGRISTHGMISEFGDLSKLAKLKLEMLWELDFNLDFINRYSDLLGLAHTEYPKGKLHGSGKVISQIAKGIKGSFLEGDLRVEEFRWQKLNIPQLNISGRYDRQRLVLSKMEVSDGIGSIAIHDTSILLTEPYYITGKGTVNEVELSHYLEIFDVKRCLSLFNVGGPFTFTGSLLPEPKISGLFDLKGTDFWLLKKKGLIPNKQNSIIDFKKGSVYGFVNFTPQGAYLDNVFAKSENNEMYVSGWIREDSTTELTVKSSSFSLDTYGRVGELPVKGSGSLSTLLIVDEEGYFKSQGKAVFTDVELMDQYFLGDVEFEISSDNDIISFNKVKAKLGNSNYAGNIDVKFIGDDTRINGYAHFKDSYSSDVYKLLKMDDRLFGNPSGMISGEISFKGLPSWNAVRIESDLRIKDAEFFSEGFDELRARFVWNKGDINVHDLYLTKDKARFDFKGIRKNKILTLDLVSGGLKLSDLSVFSKFSSNLKGELGVEGGIKHSKNKFNGNFKFSFFDLIMDTKKLKPVFLSLDFGEKQLLRFDFFDKEFCGELKKENDNTYVLRSKFKEFDIYSIGNLLFYGLDDFNTKLDGELEIKFDASGVKSVKLKIDNVLAQNGSSSLKNKGKLVIEYKKGRYSISPFSIITESGDDRCNLDFYNQGKDILAKGCLTTGLFKLFKRYIVSSRGKVDVDLIFDGKLHGTAASRDFEVTTVEQRLGSLSLIGKVIFKDNLARLDSLNILTADSTLNFSGGVDFDSIIKLKGFYPGIKAGVHVDKLSFEYPKGLKGRWSGDIRVKGSGRPYSVTGVLSLIDGSYRRDFDFDLLDFSVSTGISQLLAIYEKDANWLDLDIKIKTENDLFIRNDIFRGDLVFDLDIRGTENLPQLAGSIDLLRGKLVYMGNTFELISGRFKFKDDKAEPVVYQLDSETKVADYQIYLKLVGRGEEPRFRLSSIPPLSEDNIIALLITGEVSTDLSEQDGYTVIGEGGRIVTGGLGVTSAIRDTTGVAVKLKYSKMRDSTLPKIEFQKDLSDDVKFIYGKSLDEDVNRQEINVQYEVNKNVQLKLLLEEDKSEDVREEPASAGFDVRFKFEF